MAVDILDTKKVDEAKSFRKEFFLWPAMWSAFDVDLTPRKWQIYKFHKTIKSRIPDTIGVYSFVIKPDVADHPACSYLMYIGQTTDQTLRVRFGQYIEELEGKRKSRAKVKYMFDKWADNLFFVCMPLDNTLKPKSIEDKLIMAFLPPVNDEDTFPSEIKRIIKAAI